MPALQRDESSAQGVRRRDDIRCRLRPLEAALHSIVLTAGVAGLTQRLSCRRRDTTQGGVCLVAKRTPRPAPQGVRPPTGDYAVSRRRHARTATLRGALGMPQLCTFQRLAHAQVRGAGSDVLRQPSKHMSTAYLRGVSLSPSGTTRARAALARCVSRQR